MAGLNHGVTEKTPKSIMFGAGTIHKGLTFSVDTWNFAESLYGATSGGTKLTITPELVDIELDGMNVKTKGLTQKVGETASMETNCVEITPTLIKQAIIGKNGTGVTGFTEIVSKGSIEEGDYVTNFGFVGKTLSGTQIIVIFDNALCTSGLELEGKNKENAVVKLTMDCYGDLDGDGVTLPYHIYTPEGMELSANQIQNLMDNEGQETTVQEGNE